MGDEDEQLIETKERMKMRMGWSKRNIGREGGNSVCERCSCARARMCVRKLFQRGREEGEKGITTPRVVVKG